VRVFFNILKAPHPNPLPEYGSTELAEVREREIVQIRPQRQEIE